MLLKTKSKFLKTEEFISGDMIEILDEGEQKESDKYTYPDGTPKIDLIFKLKIVKNGKEGFRTLNSTTIKDLKMAYGEDTKKWIGKTAQVIKDLDRKLGKEIVYFEPAEDRDA